MITSFKPHDRSQCKCSGCKQVRCEHPEIVIKGVWATCSACGKRVHGW